VCPRDAGAERVQRARETLAAAAMPDHVPPGEGVPGPAPVGAAVRRVHAVRVAAGEAHRVTVRVAPLRLLVTGEDHGDRALRHRRVGEDGEHRVALEERVQRLGQLRPALLEVDPEVEGAAVAVDGAEPVDARLQRPMHRT
jgi:hypothetical protein